MSSMDQKIAPVVYDAFADIYDDVMRDVDYVSQDSPPFRLNYHSC